MAEFALKIKTDLSAMPQVVETNIDEVQPIIDAAIEKTKGLEVTDNKDEIIAADEDASKLTKMQKAIQRFRIDHMEAWSKPMQDFEEKCKKAEKSLETAATEIKKKTGEVKDLWRNRKREKCAALWKEKLEAAFPADTYVECASCKAFFDNWTNPKTKGTWVNSSVKLETTVAEAMDAEIARMKGTIEGVEANYADQPEEVRVKARLAMLQRFDMNDVIQAVNAWKKEQAEIAARAEEERKRQAEKDAAMEAQKRALAEKREQSGQGHGGGSPAVNHSPAPAPAPKPTTDDDPNETYRLELSGKRSKMEALLKFMQENGITYKNLEQ